MPTTFSIDMMFLHAEVAATCTTLSRTLKNNSSAKVCYTSPITISFDLPPEIGSRLDQKAAQEALWPYNSAVEALARIFAERPDVPPQEFLKQMLRTPLPNRLAFAFECGWKAADFERFKRVYAAASGILR